MMATTHNFLFSSTLSSVISLSSVSILLLSSLNAAHAQSALNTQAPVVVTGRAEPALDADSAQLGLSSSLKDTPQSIQVFTQGLLKEANAKSLSQTLALDASLADAYNAMGYLENLQVRGFVLDSVNNYQRNGLPTLNYAPFAAENKSQIEILKGVSGLQAGVSAPGGLVNYRVKQAGAEPITDLNLAYGSRGGKLVHLDVSRADASSGLALRVNALHEDIRPAVFHAEGKRSLVSAYLTWAAGANTTLEWDIEWQRKSQLEQPGFALLDDGSGTATVVPRLAYNTTGAIDPRTNLNTQPWSLPFQTNFLTTALTVKHALNETTSLKFAVQTQRLKTNDRIAFPDGFGCPPPDYVPQDARPCVYPGAAMNGDLNLYDFRSENERRRLTATALTLTHRANIGLTQHTLSTGLQAHEQRFDPQTSQAYNYVGVTNQFNPLTLAADPSLTIPNRSNTERVSAIVLNDEIAFNEQLKLFLGARTSRIQRSSSSLSDGAESIAYSQQITTASGGISYAIEKYLTLYASAGQGIESEVVPNRPADFVNAGEVLPVLRSRQTELGLKWQPTQRLLASAAVFDIHKPYADSDHNVKPALLVAGGKQARHTGLELNATGALSSQLSIAASAMWLRARYTQAIDAVLIGKRVTNVSPFTAALFADYKLADIKGLSMNTRLRYEGAKAVRTDYDVSLPSSWQWDVGARYRQASSAVTWRLAVENVLNRVSWKEAPTQPWGGIYLFPNAPRSVSLSAQIEL